MLPILALWFACSETPALLPDVTTGPPGAPTIHDLPPWLLAGRSWVVQANLRAVGDVAVLGSFDLDHGSCPAPLAPACLTIGQPLRALGHLPNAWAYETTVTLQLPSIPTTRQLGLVVAQRPRRGDPLVSQTYTTQLLAEQGDEDGDTYTNAAEVDFGTNPTLADSDRDGLADNAEPTSDPRLYDTDSDGFGDGNEVARGLNPADPDTDHDGVVDGDERRWRCDPLDPDSDDDGHLDGEEIAAGTAPDDPLDPWPGPVLDTATDTGAPRCPPGEIVGCWGACAPDTRHDGTCDQWLDCDRFAMDRADCRGLSYQIPGVCPSHQILSCWGTCVSQYDLSNGTCDEALSCPMRGWDDGDCALGQGATLRAYVDVDDPADLLALAGVQHLDGTLRLGPGAPSVVELPGLISLGELVVDGDVSRVSMPALQVVNEGVNLASTSATPLQVELPSLTQIGHELHLQGWVGGLHVPALGHIGQQLTVEGAVTALELPSLLTVRGGVVLTGNFASSALDLPLVTDLGDTLSIDGRGLTAVSAPNATTLTDLVYVGPQTDLRTLDLPRVSTSPEVTLRGRHLQRVDLSAVPSTHALRVQGDHVDARFGSLTTAASISIEGASLVDLHSLADVDSLHVVTAGDLDLPALGRARWFDVAGTRVTADTLVDSDYLVLDASSGSVALLPNATTGTFTARGPITAPNLRTLEILRVTTSDGGRVDMAALEEVVNPRFAWPNANFASQEQSAFGSGWSNGVAVGSDGLGSLALVAPRLTRADTVTIAEARVDLPALQETTAVWVERSPSSVTDLSLPALTEAFRVHVGPPLPRRYTWGPWSPPADTGARPPMTLHLPALQRVSQLRITGVDGPTTVDLRALTDVGNLEVEDNDGSMTLNLDALARAGTSTATPPLGMFHITDDGRDTRRRPGLDLHRNPGLTGLDLPSLTTVEALLLEEDIALTTLRAPALTTAGDILISELVSQSWGAQLAALQATTPSTTSFDLDLHALTTVNDLFVVHDRRLAQLDLPALTTVSFRARTRDVPGLQSIHLGALQTTDAWIEVTGAPQLTELALPQAQHLGRLALQGTALTALDLPGLTTLSDSLSAWSNPSLELIRAPDLTSASDLYFDANPALLTVDLPALATLSDVWLGAHTALTSFSLPALTALPGRLDVVDNTALTALDLPALQSAGEVHITGNPLLDTCAVDAELADVVVAIVELDGVCAL